MIEKEQNIDELISEIAELKNQLFEANSIIDAIKEGSKNVRITNLSGSLTFLQSAALQKGAYMNYVNDSAPMHFASAVNAPVTAIYCSTVPAFGIEIRGVRPRMVEDGAREGLHRE